MRAAVAEVKPWQAIVSSTLSRCADFARELAGQHNIPLAFDERLKEIGWGSWEGCTPEELNQRDPQLLLRYWNDPLNNIPPGAEPLDRFQLRVVQAWNDIVAAHRSKHVLLVGHAGVTRAVLAHTLQMPLTSMFRLYVANAAITRIQIEHCEQSDYARLLFHDGKLTEPF